MVVSALNGIKFSTMSEYTRPPIVEAVIEIKFDSSVDSDKLEKIKRVLEKRYDHSQPIESIGIKFNVQDQIPTTEKNDHIRGYRFQSADASEAMLIWPNSLIVSQLPPYVGWDVFFARFQREFKSFRRFGKAGISRVGIRYVNRIDIPLADSASSSDSSVNGFAPAEFMTLHPSLPDIEAKWGRFSMQVVSDLPDIGCGLSLQSQIVPPPLLDYFSLVLDIDIFREVEDPMSLNALFELMELMRLKKDAVFESCITDKSRELFR